LLLCPIYNSLVCDLFFLGLLVLAVFLGATPLEPSRIEASFLFLATSFVNV